MNIRLSNSAAQKHRARTEVAALLACAALLCLLLAAVGIVRSPATRPNLAASPVPGSPQVATASPHWQANLRTAYHAACYLLDPRA